LTGDVQALNRRLVIAVIVIMATDYQALFESASSMVTIIPWKALDDSSTLDPFCTYFIILHQEDRCDDVSKKVKNHLNRHALSVSGSSYFTARLPSDKVELAQRQ